MDGANGVNTLMFSQCKLNKHDTHIIFDPINYKSTIGTLQYVTLTRPDIPYSVKKAS